MSDQNPDDHASHGLTVKELMGSNRFIGPRFLCQRELPKEDNKVEEINGNPHASPSCQASNHSSKRASCISSMHKTLP